MSEFNGSPFLLDSFYKTVNGRYSLIFFTSDMDRVETFPHCVIGYVVKSTVMLDTTPNHDQYVKLHSILYTKID